VHGEMPLPIFFPLIAAKRVLYLPSSNGREGNPELLASW
jgi:hypothetical protein